MLGSRRLLLIGVVVVGFVVVALVLTLLTKSGDPYRSTCDKLLEYMIARNYEKSYELLSASTKSSDSKESWRSKVIGQQNVYQKGELTFVEQVAVANYTGDADTTKRAELRYTIKNPAATNDVSCYIFDNDGKVLVDGFVSKVR
jgi:hypothetical protein